MHCQPSNDKFCLRRSTIRAQIKAAIAALERDWGGPAVTSEWIIAYVRPLELDMGDKNAKKVFEKIREDFRCGWPFWLAS